MINYLTAMRKFANGGTTQQSNAQAFLVDIMEQPEKYINSGISKEFVSGLIQTIQSNPEELQDFVSQYPDDLQNAMAVFNGASQNTVAMQKLGGKVNYLHCLKHGSAVPGCNCGGAVKKAEDGDKTPAKTTTFIPDQGARDNGFAMIVDNTKSPADTIYREAYINGPAGVQTAGNNIVDSAMIAYIKSLLAKMQAPKPKK